jgi:hypothetical protein
LSFPLEIAPMEHVLYWHTSVDADKANQWFREKIGAFLKRSFASD